MASNSNIFKMSNAGGVKTLNRYPDMLAGNTTWNPWSPAGAYEPIAVATAPVGGLASITFGGIPQTYTHLQVRALYQLDGIDVDFGIRFNSDAGSNYTKHQVFTLGSGTPVATGTASVSSIPGGVNYSTTSGVFGVAVIDIMDYSSISKHKTTKVLTGSDANGSGGLFFRSGAWLNTNAISTVTFSQIGATLFNRYSSFALYGIKGN